MHNVSLGVLKVLKGFLVCIFENESKLSAGITTVMGAVKWCSKIWITTFSTVNGLLGLLKGPPQGTD